MFGIKRSNKNNNEANPAPAKKQLSPGFKKFLIFLLIMQVAGPILVLILTQALGGLSALSMKNDACVIVDVVDESCIVIEQNGTRETVALIGIDFDVEAMQEYVGTSWFIQEDYAVPEIDGYRAFFHNEYDVNVMELSESAKQGKTVEYFNNLAGQLSDGAYVTYCKRLEECGIDKGTRLYKECISFFYKL